MRISLIACVLALWVLSACSKQEEAPQVLVDKEEKHAEDAEAVPAISPDFLKEVQSFELQARLECDDFEKRSEDAALIVTSFPERLPAAAASVVEDRLISYQDGVKALNMRLERFQAATPEELETFRADYDRRRAALERMYGDLRDVMHGSGLLDE